MPSLRARTIEQAAVDLVVGLHELLVRGAAGFSLSRGRRLRVVDRPSRVEANQAERSFSA